MKTPLFYAFLATVVFYSIGCCKPDEPTFCSKEVRLGEFSTTVELPYDSFEYVLLLGENGDTGSMSINHPSTLGGGNMFFHLNPVQSFTSDCQALKTLERYSWSIRDKRALVLITLPSNPHFILIKAMPVFDETKPDIGPVAHVFRFFKEQAGNTIETTDFMSILAEETEVGTGQGKAFEYGSMHLTEVTINGKTYSDVYTNEDDLGIGIQNLYFTFNDGFVGIKDSDGVMWRLDD